MSRPDWIEFEKIRAERDLYRSAFNVIAARIAPIAEVIARVRDAAEPLGEARPGDSSVEEAMP